jgi:chromosome partitioning protein
MMGTSIITVANQKGGVGKTTSVVNLAASYAAMGKRVLVVDADFQGNSSDLLEVKEAALKADKTLAKAILEELTLDAVRLPSNTEGVDVLAGTKELDRARELMQGQVRQHLLLRSILDCEALQDYEVVIIDTHPSLDCLLISALVASHYYLIPLFPESDSARGLLDMIASSEQARRYLNPMLLLLGCVISRFDRHNATHVKFEKVIRQIAKKGNLHVYETIIPASASVAASSAAAQTLLAYKKSSPVTLAYQTLAGEILPSLKGQRVGRITTPNVNNIRAVVSEVEDAVEVD